MSNKTIRDLNDIFYFKISKNAGLLVKEYCKQNNKDESSLGIVDDLNSALKGYSFFPKSGFENVEITKSNFSRKLTWHLHESKSKEKRPSKSALNNSEIFALCKYFNIDFVRLSDELSDTDIENIVKDMSKTQTNNLNLTSDELAFYFLKSLFENNSNVAYNVKEQQSLFASLIPNEANNIKLFYSHLPLTYQTNSEMTYINRVLEFTKKGDICKVELKCSDSNDTTCEGFAIVINPQKNATCCCVLFGNCNNNTPDFNALTVIFFNLTPISNNVNKRNIRLANIMTTRSHDDVPIVYHSILSEDKIEHNTMKYLMGLAKFGSEEHVISGQSLNIQILENKYFAITKYFNDTISEVEKTNNKNLINDILEHFGSISVEKKNEYSEKLKKLKKTINKTDKVITIPTIIQGCTDVDSIMLLSFLFKHDIGAPHEKISPELDDFLNDMYKMLKQANPPQPKHIHIK
ncbi:MAG: hypothetical protein FWG90_00425 [Oscillospiraceae bacterium]|nr:hypothetical protein [Oscillospiraceae bacterium]